MSSFQKLLPRAAFAICCLPLLLLLYAALTGALTANPVEYVLNQLGLVALRMLLASLACTPLRLLFGWTWPLRLRRMLGLFAFFYASAHLLTYAFLDQSFRLGEIWKDLLRRKFITLGTAAFLILLPLAATSTKAMIKRLGNQRWKMLHKLAYLAGVLAVIHFILRVKKDLAEPLCYSAILAVLLAVRLVSFLRTTIHHHGKRSSLAE